jgi:hypothetical protein
MFGTIIFGLFVVLLWATAEPLIYLRRYLTKRYGSCNPKSLNAWFFKALNCVPCSSFYLGMIIYFTYPYIPEFLMYSIYLSGTVMLISILKNRYYDEGTFN